MKSHLFRASSILAVFLLLVAFGLPGIAQQPTTRQQQPVQQQELQIPELAIQELDSETLRIRVPRECERIKPDVQRHDIPDNFNPAGSAVTLSPALTNFLSGRNISPKGYDDPRVNRVFADSFKLGCCRICYATLEVRVKHYADLWTNDILTAGVAPFNPLPGVKFISTGIWNPPGTNPKTMTYALPTASLNSYNTSTCRSPSFLDVVAQDDTDFDYATLSVWYY